MRVACQIFKLVLLVAYCILVAYCFRPRVTSRSVIPSGRLLDTVEPIVGHNQKQSSETKKLKIGPTSGAHGLILLPGGLEHPQVPGELLFGPKLKIYVETLYWEHFLFSVQKDFITDF